MVSAHHTIKINFIGSSIASGPGRTSAAHEQKCILQSNNYSKLLYNNNVGEIEGFTSMCIRTKIYWEVVGMSVLFEQFVLSWFLLFLSTSPFEPFVLSPSERCSDAHMCKWATTQSTATSYRLHLISILCQIHMHDRFRAATQMVQHVLYTPLSYLMCGKSGYKQRRSPIHSARCTIDSCSSMKLIYKQLNMEWRESENRPPKSTTLNGQITKPLILNDLARPRRSFFNFHWSNH